MAFLATLRFCAGTDGQSSGSQQRLLHRYGPILPISEAGKRLARREHQRLRRDAEILAQWNGEHIPLTPLKETTLNEDDWAELAGFAFAHRPLLTSLGCLSRLLEHSELSLPALRGRLQAKHSDADLCQQLKISGRKALLAVQRAEAAQALKQLDAEREQRLHNRIMQWQFFSLTSSISWHGHCG